MDIICTYKCRFEIQEQKEVPAWYTDVDWLISNSGHKECLQCTTFIGPYIIQRFSVINNS